MTPKMITIHCSANSNGSLATGEDIRRYHMAPPPQGRGWKDIGYHGVIETDGGFFRGRAENVQGAHVESHNDGNLGVCLIGLDRFTPAQFKTLRWLLETWMAAYKISPDQLFGHYQWDTAIKQGKTCPNMRIEDIKLWLKMNDEAPISKYYLVQV